MAHQSGKRPANAVPSGNLKKTWDVLAEALTTRMSERPAGSVTVAEVAQEKGLSTVRTAQILRNLHKDGKLKRRLWRDPAQIHDVYVYWAE